VLVSAFVPILGKSLVSLYFEDRFTSSQQSKVSKNVIYHGLESSSVNLAELVWKLLESWLQGSISYSDNYRDPFYSFSCCVGRRALPKTGGILCVFLRSLCIVCMTPMTHCRLSSRPIAVHCRRKKFLPLDTKLLREKKLSPYNREEDFVGKLTKTKCFQLSIEF
jgi:hypothetical protein